MRLKTVEIRRAQVKSMRRCISGGYNHTAWEEGLRSGSGAVLYKADHSWSINRDPSGAVSQKDQFHTHFLKNAAVSLTGLRPAY